MNASIRVNPEILWHLHIGPSLVMHLPSAPPAFFRWTQRVVFGLRWERVPGATP